MQGNTLVILAVVGLALVCGGLMLFVAATLFRVTGHRLLGFFSLLARDAADTSEDVSLRLKSATPDLRAIAQAQDFDTALARHAVQDADALPSSALPSLSNPSAESAPFETPTTPPLGSRRSSPLDARRDDDDDLFGDMLDISDEP